ncbi:unnamed protein product [Rhizoctonia solani]|uniref:F-box domain-containing protein n=1 Tax=Rhizoctonia solani TaxID=456999 RepID=A0A8H3BK24_9AGAM|nr:unnamed protein product [Rhizoctonia solani]
MLEDLRSASSALSEALDHYVNTCAKLRDRYFEERATDKLDELLNCVANELQLVTSYEIKLKQAEAPIKAVRNNSPVAVPISRLPPEMLARIFQIVVDDQPELYDAARDPFVASLSLPKYPERLSHVCFGWRHIALTTPSLWTRIDVVMNNSLGLRSLARAKVHAERAGRSTLDVYMTDPNLGPGKISYHKPNDFEDCSFLAFPKTRMRSLNLTSSCGLSDSHHRFICYCIMNCAEQTLKQLVVRYLPDQGTPYGFIVSADSRHGPKSLEIDLPEHSLENIWHSITTLRLTGMYPYWTSRAYHQLVDLRIGRDVLIGRAPISEAQLIDILKASPRLKIFHVHSAVTGPLTHGDPITSVRLEELESLNLSSTQVNPSQILRLIVPGSRPLQLSIYGRPTDVVEHFLLRSNVTQLRLVAWGTYPPINALCLCPNLQVLVLDVFGIVGRANFQTVSDDHSQGADLRSLYILRCPRMQFIGLQQIVERHSVHELTLWNTHIMIEDEDRSEFVRRSKISGLCPVVHDLSSSLDDPDPMNSWDFF